MGTFVITLPLAVLFLARAVDGLTGGNVSVADAYVADISSDENRSRNFGKMGMASNLGFVIGPALAGILGATIYGEVLPVLVALILSLVVLVVIIFVLKESKSSIVTQIPEKENVGKVFAFECKECYKAANPKRLKLRDVFKLKYISFLLIIYFLIFIGFNIFYTAFPIHAVYGLGWTVTQIGSILRSFKRHHDIGARTGPSKSIKKILRRKISDYWKCCVRFKFRSVYIVRIFLDLFGSGFICSWQWTHVALYHVDSLQACRDYLSRGSAGRSW